MEQAAGLREQGTEFSARMRGEPAPANAAQVASEESEESSFADAQDDNAGEEGDTSSTAARSPFPSRGRQEAERNRRLAASEAGLHEDDFTRANLSAADARRIDETARLLGTPVYVVGNNEIKAGGSDGTLVYGRVVLLEQSLFEGKNAEKNKGLQIVGHEWGHRMEKLAPKEYAAYVDAVRPNISEETLRNKEYSYNEKSKLGYSREHLVKEAANDYMGAMLSDGRLLDEFIEAHRQE